MLGSVAAMATSLTRTQALIAALLYVFSVVIADARSTDSAVKTAVLAGQRRTARDFAARELQFSSSITTVAAGSSSAKSFGDGGAATSARLMSPAAIVADAAGNLIIADSVRNVTLVYAQRSTYTLPRFM